MQTLYVIIKYPHTRILSLKFYIILCQ